MPICRRVCHAAIIVAASPPPAPVPHAAASHPVNRTITRASSRRGSDNNSAAVQLALAALTIALLFGVVLVAPLPLWAGQPVGPPAPGTVPASAAGWPGLVIALVLVMGLCLPFRPYRHALDAAGRSTADGTKLVVGLTAALALVALLIYPRFGSDIFDYVGFERTWVVYGENPLVGTPARHPADWATPLVWYADQPPAYGPLWAILTWPIVRLAGDSPSLAVAGYKFFSAVAYGLCCALVWVLVEPARRKRALVLFAWSPLVLFEVLGKVHNDVLIAVGVLGALWLIQRGHDRLSLPVAIGAALVKVTALALAPPIALRLWRSGGWRALLPAALGAMVLVGLVYAPFWAGTATLQPLLHQTGRVVWSPGTLLIILSSGLPSPLAATSLVRVLLVGVWLASGAIILRRARVDTAAEVAASSGRLLLSSLLLLTTAVFGHYLVPAVALAAVSADARLEQWVFWLSIGGLAAYAVEVLALAFGPDWIGSTGYQLAGSLLLLAPALLATLRSPARSSALT
jgi:hypothetical protein